MRKKRRYQKPYKLTKNDKEKLARGLGFIVREVFSKVYVPVWNKKIGKYKIELKKKLG